MIQLLLDPKSIVPAAWEGRAWLVQDFIFIAIVSCVHLYFTPGYTHSVTNTGHIFLRHISKEDRLKNTHMVKEIFKANNIEELVTF